MPKKGVYICDYVMVLNVSCLPYFICYLLPVVVDPLVVAFQ